MNFLRFFFSKLFVKQLLWAGLIIVLFIGLCFWGLNCYTQHGKHTQVPDIEALSLETVATVLSQYELRYEVLEGIRNFWAVELRN